MLVTVTAGFGSCSGGGGGGGPQRSTVSYTVSGTVVGPGWGGSVVIQLNGGDDTTVVLPASGVSAPFVRTALPIGTPYAVTLLQAPPYSPCAFFPNGQFQTSWTGPGTGNVTNIKIHCNGVLRVWVPRCRGLLPVESVTVKTTASQPRGYVQGWPGTATGTATTDSLCNQCRG